MARTHAALLLALLFALAATAPAQRRGDYMTDKEQEAVRTGQKIENRAHIFLKIANRRLLALTDPGFKQNKHDEKWYGPLPTGTQVELLDDYRRAVEEYMAKLDDTFQRDGKTRGLVEALTWTNEEMGRQVALLESLRGKLTEPEAEHFRQRALDAARTLLDGAKSATDQRK